MRELVIFLALFAALGYFTESRVARNCIRSCGRNRQLVCATNKRTYLNRCQLEKAKCKNPSINYAYRGRCKRKVLPSPSPSPLPWTGLLRFCIGKRSRNYRDPTRCDGFIACRGQRARRMDCRPNYWYDERRNRCDRQQKVKCKVTCPIKCPNLYDPVCTTTGKTFTNRCEFSNAKYCLKENIKYQRKGTCGKATRCPRGCPMTYSPICASNKRTYSNKCTFLNAKECEKVSIDIVHYGVCPTIRNCPMRCPNLYAPVCTTKGKTFRNRCQFNHALYCEKEKIMFQRNGTCTNKVQSQTQCEVNPESRIECGYSGITKEVCESRGCCFNPNWRNVKWCYKKDNSNNRCMVNPEKRVECGWRGITKQQCQSRRGCCYNDKTRGTKWCYTEQTLQGTTPAPCKIVCAYNWDPVCATNGQTFSNMCHLNQAITCKNQRIRYLKPGECKKQSTSEPCRRRGCPFSMTPVCATNGKTYNNKCVLENVQKCEDPSIKIRYQGRCPDTGSRGYCRRTCGYNNDPVCGNDGRTYDNICEFKKERDCKKRSTIILYHGKCHQCNLPKSQGTGRSYQRKYYFSGREKKCKPFTYYGRGGNRNKFSSLLACNRKCKDRTAMANMCPRACSLIYEPVCSSNGTEYSNMCLLKHMIECEHKTIKKLHDGICTDRDKICTKPIITSNCKSSTYSRKYYYDAYAGKCKPAMSRDCILNKNSFDSEKDCMGYCHTAACTLPKKVGICGAYDPRYYFNQTTGACELFSYSGCHGNANNFLSLQECQTSCDRCTLLPASGNGYADLTRYFYNPDTKKCEMFSYSGINGNANRFLTQTECTRVCGDVDNEDNGKDLDDNEYDDDVDDDDDDDDDYYDVDENDDDDDDDDYLSTVFV